MNKIGTNKHVNILAIETSCDETSVAVIAGGNTIKSNIISSQVQSHSRFGGVVPEVASRHHVESISLIVKEALDEADMTLEDIDAVAVTQGPGLVGALLIGVSAAKSIAFAKGLPLIGVHHIAGHIYANRFVKEMEFPLLALVVSGGHTELVFMKDHYQFEILGRTRDDAVGESYDKVARALGLPYPGGPHIDRLAQEGEPAYQLPRAWLEKDSYDFSFSGLKSAVLNLMHNTEQRGDTIDHSNLAASFQQSVIDVLIEKTFRAAREKQVKQLLLAGGVSANRGLRTSLQARSEAEGIELIMPPLPLCTDNAAMIGAAAAVKFEAGIFSDYALNAVPSLSLEKESITEDLQNTESK